MTLIVNRSAAMVLAALVLAACGGAAEESQLSSSSPEPSAAVSAAESSAASTPPAASTAPSQAAPSEDSVASVCLEADILAAFEGYFEDLEVADDPSMEEVADALAALELEGIAADHRDGVVAALRGETGETDDEWKIHDAMFPLAGLQSEIELVAC